MSTKKSLQKLQRLPTSMKISEVINIMLYLGYNLRQIHGSHYIFTKPNAFTEAIPTHQGQVKRIYLKQIHRLLGQVIN